MIMRTLLKEAKLKINHIADAENPDSEKQDRDFLF